MSQFTSNRPALAVIITARQIETVNEEPRPCRLVAKHVGYHGDRVGGVVQCRDDEGEWYDIDLRYPEARTAYPAILDALAVAAIDAASGIE